MAFGATNPRVVDRCSECSTGSAADGDEENGRKRSEASEMSGGDQTFVYCPVSNEGGRLSLHGQDLMLVRRWCDAWAMRLRPADSTHSRTAIGRDTSRLPDRSYVPDDALENVNAHR